MSRNDGRRRTPFASSSSAGGGGGGVSVSAGRNGTTKEIEPFRRFDVVLDDSDHFYRDASLPIPASTQKKIMQEWRLLEQHLPESITVRAYEKKVDLLRAAIVGAATTPYHDGLYFFDISFPPNYPAQPPLVHYRSFGYRINPNLYATGAVCLSLLNTWFGRGESERWNPRESTILQVLLSIQALVLNERPYFNEPGHGVFVPGTFREMDSFAYNENAFVISCKSMLRLLASPPRGFEVLIARHFQDRACAILRACEAYANGRVQVGYFQDGMPPPQGRSSRVAVSHGFKEFMKSLYPLLFRAFSKEGASLAGLRKRLRLDQKGSGPPPAPRKKGLVANVVGMVKKFFGSK